MKKKKEYGQRKRIQEAAEQALGVSECELPDDYELFKAIKSGCRPDAYVDGAVPPKHLFEVYLKGLFARVRNGDVDDRTMMDFMSKVALVESNINKTTHTAKEVDADSMAAAKDVFKSAAAMEKNRKTINSIKKIEVKDVQ